VNKLKKGILRAFIEVGFIIFLFYSNLLMGEYIKNGVAYDKGLLWAIGNIITPANFVIAIITGIAGYLVVELLRKKLQ